MRNPDDIGKDSAVTTIVAAIFFAIVGLGAGILVGAHFGDSSVSFGVVGAVIGAFAAIFFARRLIKAN